MKLKILPVLLFSTSFLFAQQAQPNQDSPKVEKDSIKEKVNSLNEVTVTAQKKYIKVDSDKTTISVKTTACSTVEAVLKL